MARRMDSSLIHPQEEASGRHMILGFFSSGCTFAAMSPLNLHFARLLLTLLLLLVAAGPSFAFDAAGVDQDVVQQLTGGSPLVVVEENKDGSLKLVTGGVLVEAPPEVVWEVITDYARYPEWMPEVEEMTVLKEEGNMREVRYDLLFKISIIKRKVTYTMRMTSKKPETIEWELIDGDFDYSVGGWQLVPTQDGKATMAYYSTYTNLRSMGALIGGLLKQQPALEMAIQVSTAVTVVQKLRERVEAQKSGKLAPAEVK